MLHPGQGISEGQDTLLRLQKKIFSLSPGGTQQHEQMERKSLDFVLGGKALAEHSFSRHCWIS